MKNETVFILFLSLPINEKQSSSLILGQHALFKVSFQISSASFLNNFDKSDSHQLTDSLKQPMMYPESVTYKRTVWI